MRMRAYTKLNDAKLIQKCIEFASATIAVHERYEAVPESLVDQSVNEKEERRFSRNAARVARQLAEISRTPAVTVKGLCAKARIVPVASKYGVEENFASDGYLLESIAADVLALFGDLGKTASAASVVEVRQ
jgi:hypothetical protein